MVWEGLRLRPRGEGSTQPWREWRVGGGVAPGGGGGRRQEALRGQVAMVPAGQWTCELKHSGAWMPAKAGGRPPAIEGQLCPSLREASVQVEDSGAAGAAFALPALCPAQRLLSTSPAAYLLAVSLSLCRPQPSAALARMALLLPGTWPSAPLFHTTPAVLPGAGPGDASGSTV